MAKSDNNTSDNTRCGFIAVVGHPNAGKSTLVNQLVGEKVSIVTHKVQTTRAQIRGLALFDETQIILIDTPGILDPNQKWERAMLHAAQSSLEQCDGVMLLLDVSRNDYFERGQELADFVKHSNKPCMLVLNKIDQIARDQLLPITDRLQGLAEWSDIFMISALKNNGLNQLVERLKEVVPEGPHLYPDDMISDMPKTFWASEITREKLFLNVHEELPYSCTVETNQWELEEDGTLRIGQTIYVERDSHKGIVVGKGGRSIKRIGQAARLEMEKALDQHIYLDLHVKLQENWKQDPERLKAMSHGRETGL